jgi:hypothetical protein
MPEKKTIKKARELKREGKSPSAQAGEFVRQEIDNIREGKHGARSTKQAIAIGLSEARRAGVKLPPPKKGEYSEEVTKKADQDLKAGQRDPNHKPDPERSEATTKALQREGKNSASHAALSRHAKTAAANRTAAERSASAKKGAQSRTAAERSASAKKAAATRKRNER